MTAIKLEPDDIISVGFGDCYLLKNNEVAWREHKNKVEGLVASSLQSEVEKPLKRL